MNRCKRLIFLLALSLSQVLNGQQLLFTNISNELGLPAKESYNVMQDKKGFIWISTEAGLCKYNGSYSKIFDKKNGFKQIACFAITEDPKGGLWILSSGNHIYRYLNDSLFEAPFSQGFSTQFKNKLEQAYSLTLKNDSIIISTQSTSFLCFKNSKKIVQLEPEASCTNYFMQNKGSLINLKSNAISKISVELANKGIISFGIENNREIRHLNYNYKNKNQPSWRVLTASNKKGEHFIANGTLLLKVNKDLSSTRYELGNDVLSLYCDEQNGLWVSTAKDGVAYYPDTRNMNHKIINLKGYSVTGVVVDAEKGVWCTTLEKGVFYCRNKNVLNYSNYTGLDRAVDLLKYEGGKIFVHTGNNELIEFTRNEIKLHPVRGLENRSLFDLVKNENGWVLSGINIILKTDSDFKNNVYITQKGSIFFSGAKQLSYAPNGRLFGINYGEVLEIAGNNTITRKTPLESGGRNIFCLNNNTLLFGCNKGLYQMLLENPLRNQSTEHEKRFYKILKVKEIEGSVTKILKCTNGDIWISTKENGIYLYSGKRVRNMTRVLNLPTDRFYDLAEDRFGTIWIGSNAGLIRLRPPGKLGKADYTFSLYTTLNGLPSNEIYKIAIDPDFIYLSSSEGISRFDLKQQLNNTVPPLISINNIKVNGTDMSPQELLSLAYDQNNLSFEFNALTFKETNAPGIFYTLKGLNGESLKFKTIKGNVLSFDNLSPDSYQLKVYAINSDGIRSLKPIAFSFEIKEAFWENNWFIFGMVVLVMLLIGITFRLVIRQIRKKEERKTLINKQLAEFQLTALQAQMNPHFIFNAINSIQNYILKQKVDEAYNYLAKFSKLIRMVLNNSDEKTLTLDAELETVKLYIELEQMRFNKKFEFKLEIDESLDVHDTQIPTMLIQPYVENAIWHGLMNIEGERKGILSIRISGSKSVLNIVIEDNGIGREQAQEYKKESIHKPLAMNLTAKRIFIINAMQDYAEAKVLIRDLTGRDNKCCGTQVEIILPLRTFNSY